MEPPPFVPSSPVKTPNLKSPDWSLTKLQKLLDFYRLFIVGDSGTGGEKMTTVQKNSLKLGFDDKWGAGCTDEQQKVRVGWASTTSSLVVRDSTCRRSPTPLVADHCAP